MWECRRGCLPPPPVRSDAASARRPDRAASARPAAVREVAPPSPRPVPPAPVIEPDVLPADDAPAPCFVELRRAARPGGQRRRPGGSDGRGWDDATAPARGPVRVGGHIQAAARTVTSPPCTRRSRAPRGVSAVVILECVIDRDRARHRRRASSAAIRCSTRPPSPPSASGAYTPTRLNGVPVPVVMTVTVRFTARSMSDASCPVAEPERDAADRRHARAPDPVHARHAGRASRPRRGAAPPRGAGGRADAAAAPVIAVRVDSVDLDGRRLAHHRGPGRPAARRCPRADGPHRVRAASDGEVAYGRAVAGHGRRARRGRGARSACSGLRRRPPAPTAGPGRP